MVPDFIDEGSKKRNLKGGKKKLTLAEIDVNRDVFQVNYLTSNDKDGNLKKLDYSAEIKTWEKR